MGRAAADRPAGGFALSHGAVPGLAVARFQPPVARLAGLAGMRHRSIPDAGRLPVAPVSDL